MSARDELALELFIGDNGNQPRESSVQDWTWFRVTGKQQGQVEHYKAMADHLLSIGYRKTDPKWAETLTNDGTFEYTVSSDCDGSNVTHWRRTPGKLCIEDAGAWEEYEPEAQS